VHFRIVNNQSRGSEYSSIGSRNPDLPVPQEESLISDSDRWVLVQWQQWPLLFPTKVTLVNPSHLIHTRNAEPASEHMSELLWSAAARKRL
jgi:hypothetical protein